MPKRLTFVVEQWVLFGPRRLRLITWPCDLDIWPWRSLRLWLTPVVVLHPYTKFEVRRSCRTEDMCILHSLLSYVARANKSQDHSRALQACISPAPKNWRRRPVRPRHTWLRTVEEDLRQFNLGFGELKTEQLGGHSQEQQRHRQAPIDDTQLLVKYFQKHFKYIAIIKLLPRFLRSMVFIISQDYCRSNQPITSSPISLVTLTFDLLPCNWYANRIKGGEPCFQIWAC